MTPILDVHAAPSVISTPAAKSISIPRTSLNAALEQVANQFGLQLARFADEVDSQPTVGPLQGLFTQEQALNALLKGSGLTFRMVNNHTVAIIRAETSAQSTDASNSIQPPADAHRDPKEEDNALIPDRPSHVGIWSRIAHFFGRDETKPSMAPRPVPLNPARATLFCTALAVSSSICAQTAPTPSPSTDQSAGALEEIVVTGTQIRGVDAPVGSSIVSLSRTDIDALGANTTMDVLLQQPQIFDTGITDTNRIGTGGNGNISYGSAINLRGLSPEATLTLVNGHRITPAGTLGAAVDPNVIPSIMLDHVDIVADGASATYGSDAIAGVVNLVLRRNFNGVEVSARQGWADDYHETQVNGIVGHTWDTGQLTFAAEFDHNSDLNGSERSFYGADLVSRGGNDFRTNQCNPGTISVNGTNYAIPASGVTSATAASLLPNTQNLCDPEKYNDLIPEHEHSTVALTFDQNIGAFMRVYADAYFAYRKFWYESTQPGASLTVTSANPYFVAPPGTGATSEVVNYWFGNQGIGNTSTTTGYSENYTVTLGTEFSLPADWKFNTYGSIGYDHDLSSHVSLNTGSSGVSAALASTSPASALNLFGPNNTALLAPLANGLFSGPGITRQYYYDAKFDGPLFPLPAGPIRAAVGDEYEWQSTSNGVQVGTAQDPVWLFGVPTQLERRSNSIWGELLVPLVGTSNAVPGMQRLDLDVGVRTSDYSGIGRTTDPKIGLNWTPLEDLKLHSSYGKSFRAPLLTEIYAPAPTIQPVQFPSPGGLVPGYVFDANNFGLKPETATTWSFGGDWTPDFVPGIKVSLNYFNIVYKDQIASQTTNQNILFNPSLYSSVTTYCPSTACTALLNQYLLGIGPNAEKLALFGAPWPNPGVIENGDYLNLGTTKTSGVDYDLAYQLPETGLGKLQIGVNGTYFLSYKGSMVPGGPLNDELNHIDYPLQFRLRGTIHWHSGQWNSLLTVNYENGYTNNLSTPIQHVDSWTTADFNLNYDLSAYGGFLQGTNVGLNIRNLFDAKPPFVNVAESGTGFGGYDPQVANPIGRLISIRLDKRF